VAKATSARTRRQRVPEDGFGATLQIPAMIAWYGATRDRLTLPMRESASRTCHQSGKLEVRGELSGRARTNEELRAFLTKLAFRPMATFLHEFS